MGRDKTDARFHCCSNDKSIAGNFLPFWFATSHSLGQWPPVHIASEFKDFCTANNITHIHSTQYHPKTNGLAEQAVRTFKERFSATRMHSEDLDLTLQRFLISRYRNTPHKSTGRSPAKLLLGRRIRTKLDLLKPDINHYMDKALTQQKVYHDTKAKFSSFSIGDLVWVERPEARKRIRKRFCYEENWTTIIHCEC